MPAAPETVTLLIEFKPDPQARKGHAERHPDYRLRLALKRMLRDYGMRCVKVMTAKEPR